MHTSFASDRIRFITILALGIGTLLIFRPELTAADGDLDPSFAPAGDFDPASNPAFLGVINGHLYFATSSTVKRLSEDGSLDAEWSLPLVGMVGYSIRELRKSPWGEWMYQTPSTVYVTPGVDVFDRRTFSVGGDGLAFPLDHGGIVFANPVRKFHSDGTLDLRFGNQSTFVPAPFNDQAGKSVSGVTSTVSLMDEEGRMIVGGNFKQVGVLERMALVRILSDGTPDPTWNPGVALGIGLVESDRISALPSALALGPQNSMGLRLVSTTGEPVYSFAVVQADGTVSATFGDQGLQMPTAPVVQPDGGILLAGAVDASEGEPLRAVIRLEPDGTPDPSFNVEFGSDAGSVWIRKIALDEHGRLWIDGFFDTVNGEDRSGLARVFAHEQVPVDPQVELTAQQPRIAIDEILHIAVDVDGYPPPGLQWYLDDVALIGQTNRGLRIPITGVSFVGEFKLVATNGVGAGQTVSHTVELAEPSTVPGSLDPDFQLGLPQINHVMHLLPSEDGGVFVGGGDDNNLNTEQRPMVGRLTAKMVPDTEFGDGGFVSGDGIVETLRLLPGGGLVVAGKFTELGGVDLHGFAVLNADGEVLDLDYPVLDAVHVSGVLPLPDGRMIISGLFSEVNGQPAYRLARLNANLSLDPTFASPLEAWQFVDDMALDLKGRLLIAGGRIFVTEIMTDPAPVGLRRLLGDGSFDPAFHPVVGGFLNLFVEPGGTLLVGLPPSRHDSDGMLLVEFEGLDLLQVSDEGLKGAVVRLPDGSVVGPGGGSSIFPNNSLMRWSADGSLDLRFQTLVATENSNPTLRAACLMPDGSLLVSVIDYGTVVDPPPPEEARRLVRVPLDPDTRLKPIGLIAGEFRVSLETQPGREYEIRRRGSLDSPASETLTEFGGDGYVRDIATPADQSMLFLELHRK